VFQQYVEDIVRTFRGHKDMLMWDLYNEPGNSHKPEEVMPLLKNVVLWARMVNPSQPMTIGVWNQDEAHKEINKYQIGNSDIITFHNYSGLESMKQDIAKYRTYGKWIVCTEYIARGMGSKFETHLPLLKAESVGAINWGLVSGKTQTIYPWGSKLNAPEPNVWHHDIFRKDGTPFDANEVALIKKVTGKIVTP
jgi:hypothetical protein